MHGREVVAIESPPHGILDVIVQSQAHVARPPVLVFVFVCFAANGVPRVRSATEIPRIREHLVVLLVITHPVVAALRPLQWAIGTTAQPTFRPSVLALELEVADGVGLEYLVWVEPLGVEVELGELFAVQFVFGPVLLLMFCGAVLDHGAAGAVSQVGLLGASFDLTASGSPEEVVGCFVFHLCLFESVFWREGERKKNLKLKRFV